MHIENEKEAAMVSFAGEKTKEQTKSEKEPPLFRAGEYVFSKEKSAENLRQEFADFIDKVLEKGNDNIESLKVLLAAELFHKGIGLEEKELGKLFWSLVADRLKTEFRLIAEKLIETGAYLMSEEKLEEEARRSLLGLLKRLSRSMEREKNRGDHLSELDFRFHKYLEDSSALVKSQEEGEQRSLRALLKEAAADSEIRIEEKKPTKVGRRLSSGSEEVKRSAAAAKKGLEKERLFKVPREAIFSRMPFEEIKPGIWIEVEKDDGSVMTFKHYEVVGTPGKNKVSGLYDVRLKDRTKSGVPESEKYETLALASIGIMQYPGGYFDGRWRLKDWGYVSLQEP